MDSFTEVVLPDHLTICNRLYIMSTARDRGWKEQWFKKNTQYFAHTHWGRPSEGTVGCYDSSPCLSFPVSFCLLITRNSWCLISFLMATSWHKLVAGAPAIMSNIPGSQTGKGWSTNWTPAAPCPCPSHPFKQLSPIHPGHCACLPEAAPRCKGGGEILPFSCVRGSAAHTEGEKGNRCPARSRSQHIFIENLPCVPEPWDPPWGKASSLSRNLQWNLLIKNCSS